MTFQLTLEIEEAIRLVESSSQYRLPSKFVTVHGITTRHELLALLKTYRNTLVDSRELSQLVRSEFIVH